VEAHPDTEAEREADTDTVPEAETVFTLEGSWLEELELEASLVPELPGEELPETVKLGEEQLERVMFREREPTSEAVPCDEEAEALWWTEPEGCSAEAEIEAEVRAVLLPLVLGQMDMEGVPDIKGEPESEEVTEEEELCEGDPLAAPEKETESEN